MTCFLRITIGEIFKVNTIVEMIDGFKVRDGIIRRVGFIEIRGRDWRSVVIIGKREKSVELVVSVEGCIVYYHHPCCFHP